MLFQEVRKFFFFSQIDETFFCHILILTTTTDAGRRTWGGATGVGRGVGCAIGRGRTLTSGASSWQLGKYLNYHQI